jgi:hypothetical protein
MARASSATVHRQRLCTAGAGVMASNEDPSRAVVSRSRKEVATQSVRHSRCLGDGRVEGALGIPSGHPRQRHRDARDRRLRTRQAASCPPRRRHHSRDRGDGACECGCSRSGIPRGLPHLSGQADRSGRARGGGEPTRSALVTISPGRREAVQPVGSRRRFADASRHGRKPPALARPRIRSSHTDHG